MAPRNVRPLLFAMVGLALFTFLFWTPSLGFGSLHYPEPHVVRGGASLTERLREEELRYAATLKARTGLIKKFGPRKSQIQA